MRNSYFYNLVTVRSGLIPVEDIEEGTEVLSMGKWIKAPKPVRKKAFLCHFSTLPSCVFETVPKGSVSICHNVILCKNNIIKPELSIRGYFKEDKKCVQTTFKGTDSIPYWLPRFIRYYDEPMLPNITAIGYNLYHKPKKPGPLSTEEMNDRNFEYILEGMNRRTFFFTFGKYVICSVSSWNETHRLTMRVLDIECEVSAAGRTFVKNPVNLYRHIKDEYTKSRIKDEEIVFNLKRSNVLPPYTGGHSVTEAEEVEDWVLPGITYDVNTVNPDDCLVTGFTQMKRIYTSESPENDSSYYSVPRNNHKDMYLKDNLYSSLNS